jgi:hypothetical protein
MYVVPGAVLCCTEAFVQVFVGDVPDRYHTTLPPLVQRDVTLLRASL